MARVTVKLDIIKHLKNLVDEDIAKEISDTIIEGILQHTAIGLSPVRGVGRFVGYKAQEQANKIRKIARSYSRAVLHARSGSRDSLKNKATSERARAAGVSASGYPLSVQSRFPEKRIRPVNLRLTGTMLDGLSYTFNAAKQMVTIGIFSGKAKLEAETHNLGTQEPDVPTRQFIPTGSGQEFTVSIMRLIKEVYTKRINSIIEESNRS